MKPRQKKYDYVKTLKDREAVKGRSITEYFQFLTDHPGVLPVQLDTVEGAKGCKKVFLTLHFVPFHHMWIFLLESQTPDEVVRVMNHIQSLLGITLFNKLFPCIVTDRGNEFVDALGIELDSSTGEQRTRVFYCDAYQSNQKGSIESNHRLLRYIVPKGSNIDILEPHHATRMMTHIANYPLRELSGKTSYELMSIYFGCKVLDLIQLKKVDSTKINLTPTLLAK
jgi:IS30 family transposase